MKIVRTMYHIFRNIFDTTKAFFLEKKNLFFLSNVECDELFITHTFGGGTRTYEKNYLKDKKFVFIVRNVRGFKTKYLKILCADNNLEFYIKTSQLANLINLLHPKEITLNSLVPYTNYNDVLKNLIDYSRQNKTYIRYMIHDFHCVCPHFDLISDDNKYCFLECFKKKCKLKRYNIKDWRNNWGTFLEVVKEIRVFCNSSKEIIKKTFPFLQDEKIIVVPHDMSYCKFEPYKLRSDEKTRIAIVGTCDTIAKGNIIINEFIKKYNKKEIVLLGKTPLWRENKKNKYVIQYGAYKNTDLPSLLEKYNIDFVIFPSIWPETFSYLVSELIQTGVHILAFDIGAQGEKLKNYNKGFLCKEINSESVVQKIEEVYCGIL